MRISDWSSDVCSSDLPAMLREAVTDYLGAQDARQPLASPLFADLRKLPPLLVQVADGEILQDDARRLAERVEDAGGSVERSVAPGLGDGESVGVGKAVEGRVDVGGGGKYKKKT